MERVILGIERLRSHPPSWLKKARIGLLVNQASIDASFRNTKEIVAELVGGNLRVLFAPQHGILGQMQANMVESEHEVDPWLNIPVFSLYSHQTRAPTQEMVEGIDVLLIDLQDVGARVYTFATTMSLCVEASAQFGKRVIALDRPNPLGGERVEGNLLREELRSFVGFSSLPMRHGMTMGELAFLFNKEHEIGAELEVVCMEGYRREHLFCGTGVPWVGPSPNIPTVDTTMVYPGQVLLEGTILSEGRGTTKPFECFGAPYIDSRFLKRELEGRGLPGVIFREISFIPQFDKWKGQHCHGLQLHVTDPGAFKPYYTSLTIIQEVMNRWPEEFTWRRPPYEYEFERLPFDIISGDEEIRRGLEEGKDLQEMEATWMKDLEAFRVKRQKYLLY